MFDLRDHGEAFGGGKKIKNVMPSDGSDFERDVKMDVDNNHFFGLGRGNKPSGVRKSIYGSIVQQYASLGASSYGVKGITHHGYCSSDNINKIIYSDLSGNIIKTYGISFYQIGNKMQIVSADNVIVYYEDNDKRLYRANIFTGNIYGFTAFSGNIDAYGLTHEGHIVVLTTSGSTVDTLIQINGKTGAIMSTIKGVSRMFHVLNLRLW